MPTKLLNQAQALQKIASFCTYQDRSEYEAYEKLKKLPLDPSVDQEMVIKKMKEDGFLDEVRFTRSFVRGKFNYKGWGKIRIALSLRQHRIEENLIQQVFKEELEEEAYYSTLFELLKKKNTSISEPHPIKKTEKLRRFALSRGFEAELVFKALDELNFSG